MKRHLDSLPAISKALPIAWEFQKPRHQASKVCRPIYLGYNDKKMSPRQESHHEVCLFIVLLINMVASDFISIVLSG